VNRHFILFGFAVAVVDGIAVVGVPLENEAYVYERSVTGWVHQSLLEPEELGSVQAFGVSLAMSGDSVLVGAQGESGAAAGINGNPGATPRLDSSGAAYLYRRRGPSWSQEAYMKASTAGAQDFFGMSVAMAGDLAVVGAPDEDGGFTGPYTSDYDNSAPGAGAVFVFQLHADSANYCGPAVANSLGLAANLIHVGSLSIAANDFTLQVDGLPPGQMGFFLSSMGQDFVPNPGGSQGHLCLGRDLIGRHNRPHELRVSSAVGTFELTFDLQDMPVSLAGSSILAGQTWNFQAWYRDLNPGPTSNFSNGLTARFQ
ncbi:MAG: FG-GAP repeat protein, partial [Planctomycetota bacterium]|nr:FG-GAP repeat protein [Planctomycetota bacterium]